MIHWEMFRYWRVWKQMVVVWESECERKGGIKLQPGESVSVRLPGGVSGKETAFPERPKGFI